jgi:phosphatidylinositol-3,4,5-trisphosphate 3-phosphatase/dual-specificity protein phosphatase PTEN
LEKKRIYGKERFLNCKLGLFPFSDHEPCPVKLMLDFCVDICLYFIKSPYGVAAIHCKAGKGRTGVMCICYLIFSGLCKTSDEAITHYANMRTINKKVILFLKLKLFF